MSATTKSRLLDIPPDEIGRNPDNPRLFFRDEEMNTLLASIKRFGIQVPITVYPEKKGYILIDGERRWRCAKKLNLKQIPALIQEKPSPLKNLLLMFNIHALREQWDYLTIAKKLPDVMELYRSENGTEATEQDLSEITGLTRGQIRRCRFLLELPLKYRKMLEGELVLPKTLQKLSEDFFIEMERALKTVHSRIPVAIPDMNSARDALIKKFRKGTIGNITDFRKLSKIATSISNVGIKEGKARDALKAILDPSTRIGIDEVYAEQFELRYDERKIVISIESIYEYLDDTVIHLEATVGGELRKKLVRLRHLIDRVLGDTDAV
jgi:ParB family chromosome partitioning protein